MNGKRTLLTLTLMLITISVNAQDLDFASTITRFLNNTARPAYGPIVGLVFLVTGLWNIGMVTNPETRDWKAFANMVGRFILAALGLIVVVEFLANLTIAVL